MFLLVMVVLHKTSDRYLTNILRLAFLTIMYNLH